MFAIKKFLTAFLLPPGIFIVLLFCSGVWLARRKNWKAGVFNAVLALLLWFCSTAPFADFLMGGLEKGAKIPASLHGDVIILLGGGIYEYARDLSGRGTPSEEALSRLVTAVRAQKRMNVPVIASGGAWLKGGTSEAGVLKRFLTDLGVPESMIVVEERSRDTAENARYCREICARYGFRKPLLVTSSYHMRRSVAAFNRAGVTTQPLPAFIITGVREEYSLFHYLPSVGALRCTSAALHEYLGLMFYRLTQ
ncbi:MAG: hypothetical protein FD174_2676 [Geobacteraceae bacterium]|nr:MAG: hypothetical protein FD174_2676 [Geobacteraceae bacterium]